MNKIASVMLGAGSVIAMGMALTTPKMRKEMMDKAHNYYSNVKEKVSDM